MNANSIGSTQFADACKIPRPTLSQILSGRNKKISDEVISKIHEAYPQLSVLWLLFGEGDMLARGNNAFSGPQNGPRTSPQPLPANDFRPIETAPADNSNGDEQGLFGGDELIFDYDDREKDNETPLPPSGESGAPTVQIPADGSKSIVNIMVFYSDNSYQSFVPR